ncbi:MAG: Rhomboid family protein [Mycobacterium sp.]|nr:Rhomboid family protein [Mycobacterium sp.]
MSTSGPPQSGPAGPAADPVPRTCYRHKDRTTYVSCVRCGRPICAECMRPAPVGFQCPDDVAAGAKEQRPLRNQFGARQVYGRAYVTFTMLAINVIAFILQGFPITEKPLNQFSADYASWNSAIAFDHEYYRLLTGAFLHVAIWHIGLNMLVLVMVGPAVEAMLGRMRFTALYLLAAIGGNVLAYVVKGPSYVSVGASGAIFGLFAAYWVLARRVRADTSAMTGTIVINLVLSVTIAGISLWGHIGGLITGALVGAIYAYSGARRWHLQLAGVVVVALILVVATAVRTSTLT